MLNIQGFNPSASSIQRWKLDYLSNLIHSSTLHYPIVAITETWLKPFHSDAQVGIANYNVFRGDRVKREHGGTLLYVHQSIPVTSEERFDDDVCAAIFLTSKPTNVMVACIYKPCDASHQSFAKLLSFLDNCIKSFENSDKFTKIFVGDLNFPNMWTPGLVDLAAKSQSEQALNNFMTTNFLCQYVDVPTRESNILDLFLTNNDRIVQHVKSEKHKLLSDHNLLEITVPQCEFKLPTRADSSRNDAKLVGFNALNLNKANYDEISKSLNEINWE